MLWKERFGAAEVEEQKRDLGSYAAAAQLQQRPAPAEGGILKRAWWKLLREMPRKFDEMIQSWDCSFKETSSSDYVVGQVWGRIGADKYLVDQVRRRMDCPTTIQEIVRLSVGGTAQVRHAFRKGFTFQGAYTFGRAIDYSDTVMSNTAYLDIANRRLDRAQAGFNVPQKGTIVGVWEMPFLRGRKGALASTLGGWQLSGDTILQKGTPLTVTSSSPYPTGDWNADNTTGDRPNAPAATLKQNGFQRSDYLSGIFPASAFPRPALGTDGNLGRNVYRGPGFAETDASLTKKFRITERLASQLRFDAFNVFNRVNLANPVMDLSSASFGHSTSTLTPRVYQVSLRMSF